MMILPMLGSIGDIYCRFACFCIYTWNHFSLPTNWAQEKTPSQLKLMPPITSPDSSRRAKERGYIGLTGLEKKDDAKLGKPKE